MLGRLILGFIVTMLIYSGELLMANEGETKEKEKEKESVSNDYSECMYLVKIKNKLIYIKCE